VNTMILKSFEVFWQFLILGCISFGGPAAHIGYFRKQFVERLNWVNDKEYAEFIALSHFLPGPGSSQIGFAIGYSKAGFLGAWMAFWGFTLPSFLIMLWLALYQPPQNEPVFAAILSGLKLLAVVIVADAVIKMFKQFCLTTSHRIMMFTSTITALTATNISYQILILPVAFGYGWWSFKQDSPKRFLMKKKQIGGNRLFTIVFSFVVIVSLIVIFTNENERRIFVDFVQTGLFVFGGGHVVLPLLQGVLGTEISTDHFLVGYAAAQALPGPMFTLSSYLGALLLPASPIFGALIATVGVFMPGLLLMLWLMNQREYLSGNSRLQHGFQYINAAVVGLLFSAFIHPVTSSAVSDWFMALIVIATIVLMQRLTIKIGWLILIFAAILPFFKLMVF
jgi:chromate transporter